jgi:phosphopantothenoylcysteine decarboxylase/phosphopantothenate--cysteine ligase
VVVTAGPTYEDIDPVRYIGNRSSGRMGYALATEAVRRGARVVLVSGPTPLTPPEGVEIVRVRSAAQMRDGVHDAAGAADIIVMAAAVADYTPADGQVDQKIEKKDGSLELRLTRTTDILADLGRARRGASRPLLIGFAAETSDPVARGRAKLARKGVDMIVANDVTRTDSGFDSDLNEATLITADREEHFPLGPKTDLASRILDRAEQLLHAEAGS